MGNARPPKIQRPATFDHLKSKKQPIRREVVVPFDDAPTEAYEEAKDLLQRSKLLNEPTERISELTEAMEKAEAELRNQSMTMVFESIGRKAFRALMEEHPPAEGQMAEWEANNLVPAQPDKPDGPMIPKLGADDKPDWDVETFGPALIAASCSSPKMTVEQVHELWEEWNDTEIAELWMAALEVNNGRRTASWGKG